LKRFEEARKKYASYTAGPSTSLKKLFL
jgi:hypothetical protein